MSEGLFVVGVDPGLGGALALLRVTAVNTLELVSVIDMPVTGNLKGKGNVVDLVALTDLFSCLAGKILCVYIEAVSAMPSKNEEGKRDVQMGASSAFKFGGVAMAPEAIAVALRNQVRKIWPQTWKKEAGLLRKDKSASLALARQEFPNMQDRFAFKKNEGRAEAALVGLIGHRLYGGTSNG